MCILFVCLRYVLLLLFLCFVAVTVYCFCCCIVVCLFFLLGGVSFLFFCFLSFPFVVVLLPSSFVVVPFLSLYLLIISIYV